MIRGGGGGVCKVNNKKIICYDIYILIYFMIANIGQLYEALELFSGQIVVYPHYTIKHFSNYSLT